jgi:outer membrane lipoprotein-sorting protein
MKKKLIWLFLIVMVLALAVGCATQAEKASYNVSKEADNFNVIRQLTVIDCITGDVLFQMTGKISIQPDPADNQLEIIVEDEFGDYQKHFVGLSDNVTYVVEQKQSKDVSNYRYTLNFNPAMWFPVDVKTID